MLWLGLADHFDQYHGLPEADFFPSGENDEQSDEPRTEGFRIDKNLHTEDDSLNADARTLNTATKPTASREDIDVESSNHDNEGVIREIISTSQRIRECGNVRDWTGVGLVDLASQEVKPTRRFWMATPASRYHDRSTTWKREERSWNKNLTEEESRDDRHRVSGDYFWRY